MGNDVDDCHSTSGFCIFLGDNLVSPSAKKQLVVSCSTTEVEYQSLALALMEIIWLRSLLRELHVTLFFICDNLSIVLLSRNPIIDNRTKHLELDLYFSREKVHVGHIIVPHISLE